MYTAAKQMTRLLAEVRVGGDAAGEQRLAEQVARVAGAHAVLERLLVHLLWHEAHREALQEARRDGRGRRLLERAHCDGDGARVRERARAQRVHQPVLDALHTRHERSTVSSALV